MPIANVIRIMRRILPPHAKISDDAKETIQECVSEYISFITGEANDRCQQEQRKTITAEDVLWAMGKLGFDDYVGPLAIYLNRYREIEGDRASNSLRGEAFYLNKRSNDSNTGGMDYYYGPPPPPGMLPPYAPPHHQAMGYLDPAAAAAAAAAAATAAATSAVLIAADASSSRPTSSSSCSSSSSSSALLLQPLLCASAPSALRAGSAASDPAPVQPLRSPAALQLLHLRASTHQFPPSRSVLSSLLSFHRFPRQRRVGPRRPSAADICGCAAAIR